MDFANGNKILAALAVDNFTTALVQFTPSGREAFGRGGAKLEGISVRNGNDTHLKTIGYILWIFGFTGAHRFYYGKPLSGTIWFFTLGLLGIGWLIDLFLIPSMDREADLRFHTGPVDYTIAWVLLTFLGFFGIHRMYMGKWISGLVYLLTAGLLCMGYLYDLWTLNDQVTQINRAEGI